ncbi:MAG: transporter substrate-binding domain-containing protein [Verrucomicrobiota bacterium]
MSVSSVLKAAIAIATLVGLVACGGNDSRTGPLVVGMELAYPPFEMSDKNDQPIGISVEIARALGEHLGRPIKIENIPFDGLIASLRTGKIDLIISSMTATEQRAKTIDFSDPYLETGLCLLVSKDSDIQEIGQLNQPGRKVAVKNGTTGHNYAANEITAADVLLFDKESEAVLEVSQGKVDAFIYDQMSTYKNWTKRANTTRAILKPFKKENWAVGIKKGNEELRLQVNEFLRTFKAQGGFEKLGDKYLAEQKEAFAKLGYPFYF